MTDETTETTSRRGAGRRCKILRDSDGTLLGANVFLTPSQLETIGIEPDTVPELRYWVGDEHELCVEPRTFHEDAAAVSTQTNLKLEEDD